MIFEYTEWGTYTAKVTSEIKIEDINKILKDNYPTAEPVTEAQVRDIMNHSVEYDNTMIVREDGIEEFLIDVIYDIVSDLRYNEYDWELYETDMNDDNLENIIIKEN